MATTDFDTFLSDLTAPMEITWSSATKPKVQADLRFYERTIAERKRTNLLALQRASDEAVGLIYPPDTEVSS